MALLRVKTGTMTPDNSGHKYFPFLNCMLADLSIISLPLVVSNAASEHWNRLETNFKQYFTSDFSSYAWIRNSFSVSVVPSMFSGPQKEEFIDISCNNTLKSKMDRFCTNFWIEASAENPVISKATFKSKYRSKFEVEQEMGVAVSNMPTISGALPKQELMSRIKFNYVTMRETFVKLGGV